MRLSRRLDAVAPSTTLALAQKAKELAAAGVDVVNLTAGEPDFSTPEHVRQAMYAATERGETRYTAVTGVPQLITAIRNHYEKRSLNYGADQVIVSTGAKQCLFNALMALLEPGDEGVIVAPYWLSYVDMIRLAGGREKVVHTTEADGFLMAPAQLENALSSNVRVLLLNSPSNPAGAVYSSEALGALAEVLRRHPQVTIISDEIYERIYFGEGRCPTLLEVAPDLVPRTLVVNGCSKSYAMTGLRLGWAVGPKALISAMAKMQGQSTSGACAPVQWAALAALEGDQGVVETMRQAYDQRRRFVIRSLRELPQVGCFDPQGAFYALPNLSAYVGRRLPSGEEVRSVAQLAGHLVHAHALVTVPGEPFGAPDHLRLSIATNLEVLDKGVKRLGEALATLL